VTANLNLTEDQRQIVDLVKDVLEDKFPLSRFRVKKSAGEFDNGILSEVAELGWMGLGIGEEHGGAGFGLVEDVLLFRELGRHLVTPSVMAGSLAAHLALALGDSDLAEAFISGSQKVCIAAALTGPAAPASHHTHLLFDAADAGYALFWDNSMIACVPMASITSRREARSVDRTVSATRAVARAGDGLVLSGKAAEPLIRRSELLIAAQLLGTAESARDLAIDYAKVREQFGQPIGAFQAIKHRCSDMKVRTKVLSALVIMAALCEHEDKPDAAAQVTAAALLARSYALENASAGIQIHGAMGFTAECNAHLFLLRSHLLRNLGMTAPDRQIAMVSLPLRSTE
jgi:alkylation response protein AidB-like acyl-CoA dehydrogenase